VTKPAALIALIAWFSQVGGWQGSLLWFGLALCFSLVGDVMLLWPDRFFYFGLISFFLAHVGYIVGLNQQPVSFRPAGILILVLVIVVGALDYFRLRRGMSKQAETAKISARVPVAAYSSVLALMLLSAWMTLLRPQWPLPAALLAGFGATLFFISDSLLASGRFVGPVPHEDFWVMSTYHLGQLGLVAGALLALA
jgi:uncharacterized membrane protein YhhN